jgi:hypothetical protein
VAVVVPTASAAGSCAASMLTRKPAAGRPPGSSSRPRTRGGRWLVAVASRSSSDRSRSMIESVIRVCARNCETTSSRASCRMRRSSRVPCQSGESGPIVRGVLPLLTWVQHSRRQLAVAVAGRSAVRRFFGHDVAPHAFSHRKEARRAPLIPARAGSTRSGSARLGGLPGVRSAPGSWCGTVCTVGTVHGGRVAASCCSRARVAADTRGLQPLRVGGPP